MFLDKMCIRDSRWADIVEGADIISQLVRDYRELSSDIDAAEELFEVYPGG